MASPYFDRSMNPDVEGGAAWIWSLGLRSDGAIAIAGGTSFEEPENGWAYGLWNAVLDASGGPTWSQDLEWAPAGVAGGNQGGTAVLVLPDNGLAFAGTLKDDVRLSRRDPGGQKLWQRAYGEGTSVDQALGLSQDASTGFIVVGISQAPGTSGGRPWLWHADTGGNLLASTPIGDLEQGVVRAIARTAAGDAWLLAGSLVDGSGQTRAWSAELSAGALEAASGLQGGGGVALSWKNIYQIKTLTGAHTTLALPSGGAILSLDSLDSPNAPAPPPNQDALLLRLDAGGQTVWQQSLGGPGRDEVSAVALVGSSLAGGEGLVAVGQTAASATAQPDAWLVRLDMAGKLLWQRTYGGADWDVAFDIAVLPDQIPGGAGFLLAGSTVSKVLATKVQAHAYPDAWLIRTGPDGHLRCDGKIFCTAEQVIDCHDKDPCTLDRCDPANGLCTHSKQTCP